MDREEFRADERGLALGIVVVGAMLVIAAALYIMLDLAWVDVIAFSESRATDEGARDQINQGKAIMNNIMYVPLFFVVIFIVARAVREGGIR